jgi:formylglycine-generating enzyme required for sulfatase activity
MLLQHRQLLQQLFAPDVLPQERFKIGYALNRMGDPRPGVGLRPDGLPDIHWVEIPGGEFIYQEGETYASLPTFYMAQYPITVAQYAAFIADGGYQQRHYWTDAGWTWKRDVSSPMLWQAPKWHTENQPIVGITYYEASAFACWYALKVGLHADIIRLPTEQEWEKAARGTDGRVYPWGMRMQSGYSNFNETYAYHYVGENFLKRPTAVGIYPKDRSPYGVFDMAGNVREWTQTPHYQSGHVIRGGGWFNNSLQTQTIFRNWFLDDNADHNLGFRLMAHYKNRL